MGLFRTIAFCLFAILLGKISLFWSQVWLKLIPFKTVPRVGAVGGLS